MARYIRIQVSDAIADQAQAVWPVSDKEGIKARDEKWLTQFIQPEIAGAALDKVTDSRKEQYPQLVQLAEAMYSQDKKRKKGEDGKFTTTDGKRHASANAAFDALVSAEIAKLKEYGLA